MPWSIARLFLLVGCRSASLSEENCSLFLCAAALYCAHFLLTAPYCPLLPHVTVFSPMRHRTAHLSPVLSRPLEIHAGEEKGGNGGGGATSARSWASVESCVGGSGEERGDGRDEHGGYFWAGSRRERTMPPWRQPATTSAEPRWLDAGARTRAYLDICAVGGETDFLWCLCSVLMLVLLSVWWLPYCPSLVYCGHLVCSFMCSCWARGARRGSRRGRGRVVLARGRKGVSDPWGRRPAPPGPSPRGGVTAHIKRNLFYNVLYQ